MYLKWKRNIDNLNCNIRYAKQLKRHTGQEHCLKEIINENKQKLFKKLNCIIYV